MLKHLSAVIDKDVEAVTRVLTEAFRTGVFLSFNILQPTDTLHPQTDKFNNLVVGGLSDLLATEIDAVTRAALIGGSVYVAETPEDGALGGAVWFGPGQELLEDEEQAAAGFNQFMETLGGRYPEMIPWWMDYVRRISFSSLLIPSLMRPSSLSFSSFRCTPSSQQIRLAKVINARAGSFSTSV